MRLWKEPIAFEWDKGNIDKNLIKHAVTNQEAEEVFKNKPSFIFPDETHSAGEKRYMVWGKTDRSRALTIFFTVRQEKIRVISVRDMHKKERGIYEEKI